MGLAMRQYQQVYKFGGSSLVTPDMMRRVATLLPDEPIAVVVSAIGGVTQKLQTALDLAEAGESFASVFAELVQQHKTFVEDLLSPQHATSTWQTLHALLQEIETLLTSVQLVGTYSEAQRTAVLGFGERASAHIFSDYMSEQRTSAWLDASQVLFTYHKQGVEGFLWERSRQAVQQKLQDHAPDVLVITGFLAADEAGRKRLLERNGSDISASAFAELLQTESLVIWTDCAGIYSADPRYVKAAFPLQAIRYEEALELAYFGASVIHPKMIAPAQRSQRPIIVKNTYEPDAPGTVISHEAPACEHAVRGLTSIRDVALVTVEGSGLLGVSGIAAQTFATLSQQQISVILITQASSEHSICFCVNAADAERAKHALEEQFEFEISKKKINGIVVDTSCAIVAAVGEGMPGRLGVAGEMATLLANAEISIKAIAQGSSERNISVVIHQTEIQRALRALHAGFYLSAKVLAIALVGVGVVGAALIEQIAQAQTDLLARDNIRLSVRAICRSQTMVLSDHDIDLATWQQGFEHEAQPTDLPAMMQHMQQSERPHRVVIDCTANDDVAASYGDFFAAGLHVITPNKRANSGDVGYYQQLKTIRQQHRRHFLYETTVCAGLPVIHTLQDLLRTGDKVEAITGVVSGSLSYIFSQLAKGKAFSEVVREAKQQGYTEPDPRDDLSGKDVARKMICLAREIGLSVTMEDVECVDLVPEALQEVSVETFLADLSDYDEAFAQRMQDLAQGDKKVVYMGSIDQQGHVRVVMDAVAADHPFATLASTDNMILFQTQRYHEQPLVIRGPGAGAQVTAGGVFADILRLVSYVQ